MNEEENLQQDDENGEESLAKTESSSPKISFMELSLFALPLAVIADIVDLFSWSGIGTMISLALDLFSAGALTLYLFMKGLRGEFMLLSGIVEMIPVVDFLPIRTATLLMLYFKQKNTQRGSELLKEVGKIAKK